VRYVVRSAELGMVLVRQGAVARYETLDEARAAGAFAGETFVVAEAEGARRDVLAGVKAGEGFIMVELAAKAEGPFPGGRGVPAARPAAV